MISSRCCTCLKLYPQNAPAFCLCGGSTFTTIHADDEPEAPTTSPEGGRVVDTSGIPLPDAAHYTLEPAAADSTSGPTPPPSVSESSPSSASAPKPGADFELGDDSDPAAVGGVTCGQEGCSQPATHKFYWPAPGERSTRYACEACSRKAESAAQAMGFSADVTPL